MTETPNTSGPISNEQHTPLVDSRPSTPKPAGAANPRDRDSGVFLEHDETHSSPISTPPSSRPTSLISLHHSPSVKSSLSRSDSTASSGRRLQRPAELNLGTAPDTSKPKSELELRYDLIRNSQTKTKAALRSPTDLLKDRLNLSPKKGKFDRVRIFTPPKPMLNGCILPGPEAQMEAFTGWSVRGRTEKGGRPTWWCKFDKVVVFDGAEGEGEDMKFNTRTSKGLTIARRRGDTETVMIPMDCRHCQDMLNRTEWKYDVQVCKRVVCWDCKERCKWEMEQSLKEGEEKKVEQVQAKVDANRERSDSVLQDEPGREEDLRQKIGIESLPQMPMIAAV